MSDLFGNHIVGFSTRPLIYHNLIPLIITYRSPYIQKKKLTRYHSNKNICKNLICEHLPFCQRMNMSCFMRKPTFCICENKGADQLHSNCKADQCLCFPYTDSTIPLLSKPKFPVSCHLLCLYRPVCVGPVRSTLLVFSCGGS